MSNLRTRWAAIGAAVAVSVGAGGIGLANASIGSGERPVYTAYGPCRITDTRPTYAIGSKVGPFGPGETHTVEVWGTNGECTGIPNDVQAVEFNVTAVGATQATHLTLWDSGPRPNASSLNPAPGQPPTPNAVTVNLDSNGSFRVYNFQGNVDLIIDVVGIYQDHHHGDAYYTKSETDGYLADKADMSDVDAVRSLTWVHREGSIEQYTLPNRPSFDLAGVEVLPPMTIDVPVDGLLTVHATAADATGAESLPIALVDHDGPYSVRHFAQMPFDDNLAASGYFGVVGGSTPLYVTAGTHSVRLFFVGEPDGSTVRVGARSLTVEFTPGTDVENWEEFDVPPPPPPPPSP